MTRPADARSRPGRERLISAYSMPRGKTVMRARSEHVPLLAADVALVGLAKPRRRFDQRIEHGLQIEGRAADYLEHVGGGGLLLERFAQLV